MKTFAGEWAEDRMRAARRPTRPVPLPSSRIDDLLLLRELEESK